MPESKEADIIVSGTLLTEAQSLTVRLALQHMFTALNGELGEGIGPQLKRNYLARLGEVNELLAKTAR